ncbi:DnaT-like ssDNA-binding domain-containing protein [Gammaproteobacteria bacterium]|nr:DnaT-like ssDNA-binding domain-containing protein [Gammaproteobacteria bacterium]
MSSSLVPERPLLISPTLAATIGLEEAVMLHVISELLIQHPAIYRNQRRWAELEQSKLEQAMPFWSLIDIKRIQKNLLDKGLIQIETVASRNDLFLIAINQVSIAEENKNPAIDTSVRTPEQIFEAPSSSGKASYIHQHWQPNEDLYQQCQQHTIPREFVEQRVKGFVMYWRDRQKTQYSWHHTFLKYIIKEWRQEQSYKGAKELETDMSIHWRPNGDALSILEHAGISLSFIEDAIPEFVLYWRERGLITSTWNTKFIAHIRRQWGKFNLAVENDNTPRLIPPDYEPSDACYEVLAMANIDISFARDQIKEFVLYWQDSKEVYASWNTKFLQHVKYKWANQHQSSLPMTQQIESTIERFTDRSWAE